MKVSPVIFGEPGHELDEVDLAKRCADKLNQQYPGHPWAVHINSEQLGGVLEIKNFAVSFRYGYVLKLERVYQDPSLKCVVRAGGEILERAGMIRGRWNGQDAEHIDGVLDKHQPFGGIIV